MSTLVTSNIKHSGSASNNVELDNSGNLKFNSGYGSAAVSYGCRAWVNFNGTGTVAIRASGNVSSITDNGVGNYTVNFATAMVDASYAPSVSVFNTVSSDSCSFSGVLSSSVTVLSYQTSGAFVDVTHYAVAIFR